MLAVREFDGPTSAPSIGDTMLTRWPGGRALPARVVRIEAAGRGRDYRATLDTAPGCDRCDGRLHYAAGTWRCASCCATAAAT